MKEGFQVDKNLTFEENVKRMGDALEESKVTISYGAGDAELFIALMIIVLFLSVLLQW